MQQVMVHLVFMARRLAAPLAEIKQKQKRGDPKAAPIALEAIEKTLCAPRA
jgi:hypothetical protein